MNYVEKVIFDTNVISSPNSTTDFFGNREELERFSRVSEIIIPEIVLEEIKQQKVVKLDANKKSFLDNPFHWLRDVDRDETEKYDINACAEKLYKEEKYIHKTIGISDTAILDLMQEMAVKNKAPFEKKTDKGFKDACIYFSILEYIETLDDERIFLVTKDGRLKDSFNDDRRVVVIDSFEEFKEYSISTVHEDYFIEKLQGIFGEKFTQDSIIEYWLNIEDNKILFISIDSNEYLLEIDSGEIVLQGVYWDKNEILYVNKEIVDKAVDALIYSGNYSSTHGAVAALEDYKKVLSEKQIKSILEATVENSQIIPDEDVRQFINDIFEPKKDSLNPEIRREIEDFLSEF